MEDFSKHLQNSIIYLIITDTEFCKLCIHVPYELFSSEITQLCFKTGVEYFKKFNTAPKDHFHDEMLKVTANLSPDEKESIARYLYGIRNMNCPDKSYIISRLDSFIKSSSLMKVTYEFAELVEQQQFEKATLLMQDALKAGIDDSPLYEDFLDDYSDLPLRGDKPNYITDTGIPLLDRSIGGFCKSELICIAGPYKGGKSWFGNHLSKVSLMKGLNVVHVSHENSAEEVCLRYDMMFGGLVNEEKPTEVTLRWMDERGRIHEKVELRDTVYNRELVIRNRKKVKKFGGKLIIKKFPMGSCSPLELNSYLGKIESFMGIHPDVVINDYADVMKPLKANKEGRDNLNDIYQYLKQIADERQLVMITMSQINREGLKEAYHCGKIDATHIAEDIRKIGTVDKGFFVVVPRELEEQGEAVIGCFANRNKAQGVSCVIGRNLEIGRFYNYSYIPERD